MDLLGDTYSFPTEESQIHEDIYYQQVMSDTELDQHQPRIDETDSMYQQPVEYSRQQLSHNAPSYEDLTMTRSPTDSTDAKFDTYESSDLMSASIQYNSVTPTPFVTEEKEKVPNPDQRGSPFQPTLLESKDDPQGPMTKQDTDTDATKQDKSPEYKQQPQDSTNSPINKLGEDVAIAAANVTEEQQTMPPESNIPANEPAKLAAPLPPPPPPPASIQQQAEAVTIVDLPATLLPDQVFANNNNNPAAQAPPSNSSNGSSKKASVPTSKPSSPPPPPPPRQQDKPPPPPAEQFPNIPAGGPPPRPTPMHPVNKAEQPHPPPSKPSLPPGTDLGTLGRIGEVSSSAIPLSAMPSLHLFFIGLLSIWFILVVKRS